MGLKTFRTIALGEFIPNEWLTKPIKELLKSKESEDSDAIKEEKSNVLANMGVMLVILVVMIVLILFTGLFICLCRKSPKCLNIFKQIRAKIFWNTILRFILQSYLKTTIGCLFAVSFISFGDKNKIINAVMSIAMLCFLIVIPIVFGAILHKNRTNLHMTAIKEKIGSLYLGMRTTTLSQRLYPSVFLLRRLLYAVMTVVCA